MGLSDMRQHAADAVATEKQVPENEQQVPGPQGSLMLGCLPQFQADAIGFLTDSVRRHGDIVRLRFGYVVAYLLNRPEYVEQVLARDSRCYDKNTRSVAKLRATCGDSLLSSDGKPWLRHRRLIQPVFQPRRVAEFTATIDTATREMLAAWDTKLNSDPEVDIVSEMMGVTLTVAARVLFESDVRDQTVLIEHALEVILQDTWRRLEAPLDMAAISPVFRRRKFRRALAQLDQVVYRIIESRRQTGVIGDDLLSRLLRAHEGEQGESFTNQELRDAVVTLLLAGHETTANALASAFYLISQSTETQDRLVGEARKPVRSQPPAESSEARKAFLEAIRLCPSIWIIERRAVQEGRVDRYRIPKGSTVIVSPYLLHRHPEFWQDPESYQPDRFTPERIQSRPAHAYLPFGLGPHRCIGQHLALLVATRILTLVHREFRLRLVDGQSIRPIPGITLRHDGPLLMSLER